MGIKCFIKCDILIKDCIAVCVHIIQFSFPLLLIQAFCYLTLGLCLFSTTRIPHLWLLQNVLSSPEIIFEICQFSFQDLFTMPPISSPTVILVFFFLFHSSNYLGLLSSLHGPPVCLCMYLESFLPSNLILSLPSKFNLSFNFYLKYDFLPLSPPPPTLLDPIFL